MNEITRNENNIPGSDLSDDAVSDKLIDAETPTYQVEFDAEEAERAGAFSEDALSEQDALESSVDLTDAQ
jgi:hypothetical protein